MKPLTTPEERKRLNVTNYDNGQSHVTFRVKGEDAYTFTLCATDGFTKERLTFTPENYELLEWFNYAP